MKVFLNRAVTLSLFIMVNAGAIMSQETETKGSQASPEALFLYEYLPLLIGFVVLAVGVGVIIRLVFLLLRLKRNEFLGIDDPIEDLTRKESKFSFQKILDYANKMVPVAKESTIVLGHDYDGIRELDNRLPPWWLWMMYSSMIFSVIYIYYYHFSGNNWSSTQEYNIAMAEGVQQKADYLFKMGNDVDETNVTALLDEENIKDAIEVYQKNCVACHGIFGEGGVGPNLTDIYWVSGGSLSDIFSTIKYGVPDKGMIPWKTQLGPKTIQQLASYIQTMNGTNPENAKEPEGRLYEAVVND